MVHIEECNLTGWNLRSIFEAPEPDYMESEAFFSAFGKYRDINGHRVHCVMTAPKHAALTVSYAPEDSGGLHKISLILLVRKSDISGLRQGGNLCVEGTDYLIAGLSSPLSDITRLELEGYSG